MKTTPRLLDEIDEAIRIWASQYNDAFLARMKGDDATGYRLRGEIRSRVLAAIKRASKPKKSN